MKKQSGFTLIELMVVMAIIAILATAGLTAYSNYLKKARDSSRLQVARQLMTTVENLSGGGLPPTGAALTAFMTAEGFAYRLPTMNPMIARVSGVVDNLFGTALALPDIDPLSGQATCIDEGGGVFVLCGFAYATFSDGSYIISYGIEHLDSINNFWSINGLSSYGSPVPRLFGNVIGTNAYIIQANTATYYDTDEVLQALASGVTMTDGAILSDISGFVSS